MNDETTKAKNEVEFHGVVKKVEEKVASNFTQLEKALRGERGMYVYTLEDIRQKVEQSLDYFDTVRSIKKLTASAAAT
ncbi:hypothetical protein ACLHDF_18710 [Priestia aryabhattai]|uniref:hypothetical protein n=1 Tax=Priestia megaterium TaxID=1404 RepID=UPI0039B90A00